MSAHPTADEIVCSLKKSGYLMEQRVATELEALDFHVQTNWAFEDPDQGKSRELDVRATKRVAHNQEKRVSAFLEILAECKNSENPIVLIARSKNDEDRREVPEEFLFTFHYGMKKRLPSGNTQIRMANPYLHLGIEQAHYDHHRNLKAVQFCQIYREGKNWKAGHGGLYDGFFLPHRKGCRSSKKGAPTKAKQWLALLVVPRADASS